MGIGLGGSAEIYCHDDCSIVAAGQGRGWKAPRTARSEPVVLIGHIANRAELRTRLERPLANDSQLYAAALDAWGDAADREIVGEYAAMCWQPATRSVRIVRSPINAPPLHYWTDDGRAVIASVPRAIFATGVAVPEIDEQKIADSLLLNHAEGQRSWFKGVSRLLIGTRASIGPGGTKTTTFYDPAALPEIRLASDADYVEAGRELLTQGTRAVLDGFERPAVSLSGGYDSQAVAAQACKLRPGQVIHGLVSAPEPDWPGSTVSRALHPGLLQDEYAHGAALAALYPELRVERITAEGKFIEDRLEQMFLLGGIVPRNALNLHWAHALHARARELGCDVVLSGGSGNGTFSYDGMAALPHWLASGQWGKLAREIAAIGGKRHFARALFHHAIKPLMPQPLYRIWQRLRRKTDLEPLDSWSPLNPEWAREMRVFERAADMGSDWLYQPSRSPRAWRLAFFSGASHEAGDIDQALSLLHGVALRDPTAYRPLFEFCMGIPDDQFLRGGQRRWLARRMLHGMVPDMVLNERRTGLQSADWPLRMERQRAELLAELDQLALDPAMARRFNLATLREPLERGPLAMRMNSADAARLGNGLVRALTTARFIRYQQGTNQP